MSFEVDIATILLIGCCNREGRRFRTPTIGILKETFYLRSHLGRKKIALYRRDAPRGLSWNDINSNYSSVRFRPLDCNLRPATWRIALSFFSSYDSNVVGIGAYKINHSLSLLEHFILGVNLREPHVNNNVRILGHLTYFQELECCSALQSLDFGLACE